MKLIAQLFDHVNYRSLVCTRSRSLFHWLFFRLVFTFTRPGLAVGRAGKFPCSRSKGWMDQLKWMTSAIAVSRALPCSNISRGRKVGGGGRKFPRSCPRESSWNMHAWIFNDFWWKINMIIIIPPLSVRFPSAPARHDKEKSIRNGAARLEILSALPFVRWTWSSAVQVQDCNKFQLNVSVHRFKFKVKAKFSLLSFWPVLYNYFQWADHDRKIIIRNNGMRVQQHISRDKGSLESRFSRECQQLQLRSDGREGEFKTIKKLDWS